MAIVAGHEMSEERGTGSATKINRLLCSDQSVTLEILEIEFLAYHRTEQLAI